MKECDNVVDLLSYFVIYSRQSSRDKLCLLWFNYLREKSLARIGKTHANRVANPLVAFVHSWLSPWSASGDRHLLQKVEIELEEKNKDDQQKEGRINYCFAVYGRKNG